MPPRPRSAPRCCACVLRGAGAFSTGDEGPAKRRHASFLWKVAVLVATTVIRSGVESQSDVDDRRGRERFGRRSCTSCVGGRARRGIACAVLPGALSEACGEAGSDRETKPASDREEIGLRGRARSSHKRPGAGFGSLPRDVAVCPERRHAGCCSTAMGARRAAAMRAAVPVLFEPDAAVGLLRSGEKPGRLLAQLTSQCLEGTAIV